MTIDWPNVVLGFILGVLGHMGILKFEERRQKHKRIADLNKTYSYLPGTYANYRVKDGTEEPTGGRIKIVQLADGSFEAKGLHANGVMEWSSEIKMSLEWKGTGTGRYKYGGRPELYGTQQITYIQETRSLDVLSTNTTSGNTSVFIHHWKRIEE